MNRKKALKYIENKIVAGETREQIFNSLSSKISIKSDIVQYMTDIPLLSQNIKYKYLNYTLIAILVVVLAEKLLVVVKLLNLLKTNTNEMIPGILLGGWFHFIQPLLIIYLLVGIIKVRGQFYKFIIFLGGLEIMNLLLQIPDLELNQRTAVALAVLVIPIVCSVIISAIIWAKLFPFMNWKATTMEKILAHND